MIPRRVAVLKMRFTGRLQTNSEVLQTGGAIPATVARIPVHAAFPVGGRRELVWAQNG